MDPYLHLYLHLDLELRLALELNEKQIEMERLVKCFHLLGQLLV
jgi:hypothetical protein